MNSPPIVGVDCLSRCKRTISGESLLIGSRKRRRSQAIHRGPSSTATAKLTPAASAARGVIFSHAARRLPDAAGQESPSDEKPEEHGMTNDEITNDEGMTKSDDDACARTRSSLRFVIRHSRCIPEQPGRRVGAAPALSQ